MSERGGALEIALHVIPRARRTGLDGRHGKALKLRVGAPPVDGAANRAVIDFFAALLDLPRSRLTITVGETSRSKTLRITGIDAREFRRRVPSSVAKALD